MKKDFENPICKLCGDDCSPSLSNRGWCVYCEKGYLLGKQQKAKEIKKHLEKILTNKVTKTSRWKAFWKKHLGKQGKGER